MGSSYCFNPSLSEHYGAKWKKVRIRSPENVVAELVHVKRQGPLHVIGFRESIFVYDAHWLREFGELYRREIARRSSARSGGGASSAS